MTVLEQIFLCIWSQCRSPDEISGSTPCPSPLCWCSRCISAVSSPNTHSLPHLPIAWGLPLLFVSSRQVDKLDHSPKGHRDLMLLGPQALPGVTPPVKMSGGTVHTEEVPKRHCKFTVKQELHGVRLRLSPV